MTPSPPDLPLDRDLRCMACGYNLRGLSGDPVRCPECGSLNGRNELLAVAGRMLLTLAQMESAAAYSILALGISVACVLPLGCGIFFDLGLPGSCLAVLGGGAPLFIMLAWAMAERFAHACGPAAPWRGVYLQMAALGCGGMVLIFGLITGLPALVIPTYSGPAYSGRSQTFFGLMAFGSLCVVGFVALVARPVYAGLRERLEACRRSAAVEFHRRRGGSADQPPGD